MFNWIVWNRILYMYKQDLAFKYQQWLICHKTKPRKTKQKKYTLISLPFEAVKKFITFLRYIKIWRFFLQIGYYFQLLLLILKNICRFPRSLWSFHWTVTLIIIAWHRRWIAYVSHYNSLCLVSICLRKGNANIRKKNLPVIQSDLIYKLYRIKWINGCGIVKF